MTHEHTVIDNDTHFSIDENTRIVNSGNAMLPKIMQYDCNSERLSFRLPRMIDGHDMTLCNRVLVEYINTDRATSKTGRYEVDDVAVIPNNENEISFTWLVSDNATQINGNLHFAVVFLCLDDEGKITYRWATELSKGLTVGEGIKNDEAIATEYADILEQWYKNIMETIASGGIEGGVTEEKMEQAFIEHSEDETAHADIRQLIKNLGGVKSVNGQEPDETGNVTIALSDLEDADEHINELIDTALGVIENGSY